MGLFHLKEFLKTVGTALAAGQSVASASGGERQQMNDRVAQLQEELTQSSARERQLQQELDKAKKDVVQLELLQKESDDFKRRSAPLWQKLMSERGNHFFSLFGTIINILYFASLRQQ